MSETQVQPLSDWEISSIQSLHPAIARYRPPWWNGESDTIVKLLAQLDAVNADRARLREALEGQAVHLAIDGWWTCALCASCRDAAKLDDVLEHKPTCPLATAHDGLTTTPGEE